MSGTGSVKYKPIDFDEVADIYDDYVTTDLDIGFFIEQFKGKKCRVLELMCGTGRVSIPLIQNGVDLTCVDYSPKMLGKFREKLIRKGLWADLIEGDVCKLDLGKRFDYIIIPFNSFMELVGKQSQTAALKTVYRHLKAGGSFICTLHNPAVRLKGVDGEKKFRSAFPISGGGKIILSSLENYDSEKHIVSGTQYFETYGADGAFEQERRLDILFSIISPGDFTRMYKEQGFFLRKIIGDYSGNDFDGETSPFMIFILGKK